MESVLDPDYAHRLAKGEESNNLLVRFYKRPTQDQAATLKEGRPVFVEMDYTEIRIPGQPRNVVDRKVKDQDKETFANEWNRYLEHREQQQDGIPIDQWQAITRTRALELHASSIPTVEALANVSDAALGNLGPDAHSLRDQARAFLSGDSETEKLKAEIQALKEENAKLKEKKGPGRPRKVA